MNGIKLSATLYASVLKHCCPSSGGWYWESGFDRDPIADMEYIRDLNFRAMYGAWDAMKNIDHVLPNQRLNWAAYILGKRESRRLLGDVVLDLADLEHDRRFPDGCVPTGWSNDLHLPDPRYQRGFEGDAFIAKADFGEFPAIRERRPFWIPYRSLYSRNVPNLFMAGRDISVKHEALGAVRVMRTGGCMGEIVGMAASLCRAHDTTPRGVYESHLAELQTLMRRGTGQNPGSNPDYENGAEPRRPGVARLLPAVPLPLPAWLSDAGPNLARTAHVTVSGSRDTRLNPVGQLTDGQTDLRDNASRWLSDMKLPHRIELVWDTPVEIGAARLVSGYNSGGRIVSPVTDFTLAWHDGTDWKLIPSASARDNQDFSWQCVFTPVKTSRVRLEITKAANDISRIWELELYGSP